MRIYLSDIETLRGAHIDELLQKLPECRRQKALRFKRELDRLQCLGAGLLLSHALSPFGLSEADAVSGPYGKPFFPSEALPRFSLSHSGSRVMCAVCVGDVGCDVERISASRDVLRIAERRFAPEELDLLRATEDPTERRALFFRLWTLKESFVKALGAGLSLPLDSFCIRLSDGAASVGVGVPAACADMLSTSFDFREFSFCDGYCYAVCTANTPIPADLQPEWIDLFGI